MRHQREHGGARLGAVIWLVLFVLWYLLGVPLGPGYPVDV